MPAVDGTQDDAEQRSREIVARWAAEGATPERAAELKQERLDKVLAANQARVHQEAHEPTGDWVELADDPDEASLSMADLTPPGTYRQTDRPGELSYGELNRRKGYEEGFRAGVNIGKAEAEVQAIDGQVLETSGPSDYDTAALSVDFALRFRPIAIKRDGEDPLAMVLEDAARIRAYLMSIPASD